MKVALVYDRVNKWGGAERVLLALRDLFSDATLFTSVYDAKKAPWAKDFTVKPSFLQKFSHIVGHHELYPFLMPVAFEYMKFDGYDLVISLTSEAAKGVITKPGTVHISYILTPTRYLWSGYEEYFKNPLLKAVAYPAVHYLRKWDKVAAHRPDIMVAISKEVQERIQKYYGREAAIIYPPVSLVSRDQGLGFRAKKTGSDYFLIVSRLSKFTKYKRIDLAVEACNELQLPLKIVGEGSWKKELEKLAGPTVEFIGTVNDRELENYYAQCRALIFPAVEDFGLTVVEAQGFGKPVIAYRGGGALETIKEGKTGIFFDEQTKKSLVNALRLFVSKKFDPADARIQSERFSTAKFQKEFLKLVNKVI